MRPYQLDQCVSDRRLVEACRQEGLAEAVPLPRAWHGLKDPELLAALVPEGRPLVTTDHALPYDHVAAIPPRHPGIVVVRHSVYAAKRTNRTMTSRGAAQILKAFKAAVPGWPALDVSNAVLFVSECDVELAHPDAGRLKTIFFAE